MDNGQAKIQWDFQVQTNKMVVAYQADIIGVDMQVKKL